MSNHSVGSHLMGRGWRTALQNFCQRLRALPFIEQDKLDFVQSVFDNCLAFSNCISRATRCAVRHPIIIPIEKSADVEKAVGKEEYRHFKDSLLQLVDEETIRNIEPLLLQWDSDNGIEHCFIDLSTILTLMVHDVRLSKSILYPAYEELLALIKGGSHASKLSNIQHLAMEAKYISVMLCGMETSLSRHHDYDERLANIISAAKLHLDLSSSDVQTFKKHKKFMMGSGLWSASSVTASAVMMDVGADFPPAIEISDNKVPRTSGDKVRLITDEALITPVISVEKVYTDPNIPSLYIKRFTVKAKASRLQEICNYCSRANAHTLGSPRVTHARIRGIYHRFDAVVDGLPSEFRIWPL